MPSYLDAKKAVLSPWTAYQRRRRDDPEGFVRSMLELHYYRPTILSFLQVAGETPDLLERCDVAPGEAVLDVGAYRGEWASAIAERYDAEVYAFEPVPGAYRHLARRAEAQPRIHPFEVGLGDHDHDATFAMDGPGSAASEAAGAFGNRTVRLRDVATVLDELGLDEVAWLKVNIEGGEYDLFDRLLATGWLHRVRVVSVQFHEWLPKAHRRRLAIRRGLRATHEEVWNYPWVWEVWRRR